MTIKYGKIHRSWGKLMISPTSPMSNGFLSGFFEELSSRCLYIGLKQNIKIKSCQCSQKVLKSNMLHKCYSIFSHKMIGIS